MAGLLPAGEWDWCRPLGKGSFGEVFQAYRTGDAAQAPYAVKTFPLNSSTTKATCVALLKEVEVMLNIGRHDRIVNCHGAMYDRRGKMCIVLEYMPGGALSEFLTENPQLSTARAAKCIKQMLEGVAHLHQRKIYHRDLKSANVLVKLVTSDGVPLVKLADFGTSKMKQSQETSTLFASMGGGGTVDQTIALTLAGTYAWMAPEVIKVGVSQKAYSPAKADVWSFGILCCEVLQQGKIPWGVENTAQAIFMIGTWEKDLPPCFETKNHPQECLQFLKAALKVRPGERATADKLMQHPWMAGVSLKKENVVLDQYKGPTGAKAKVTGTSHLLPITGVQMLRELCAADGADEDDEADTTIGSGGPAPAFLQTAVWTEYEEEEEEEEDEEEEEHEEDGDVMVIREMEEEDGEHPGEHPPQPFDIVSEGGSVYDEEEEEIELASEDSADAFLHGLVEDVTVQPHLKDSVSASSSSRQKRTRRSGGRQGTVQPQPAPPSPPTRPRRHGSNTRAALTQLNASTFGSPMRPPASSSGQVASASITGRRTSPPSSHTSASTLDRSFSAQAGSPVLQGYLGSRQDSPPPDFNSRTPPRPMPAQRIRQNSSPAGTMISNTSLGGNSPPGLPRSGRIASTPALGGVACVDFGTGISPIAGCGTTSSSPGSASTSPAKSSPRLSPTNGQERYGTTRTHPSTHPSTHRVTSIRRVYEQPKPVRDNAIKGPTFQPDVRRSSGQVHIGGPLGGPV